MYHGQPETYHEKCFNFRWSHGTYAYIPIKVHECNKIEAWNQLYVIPLYSISSEQCELWAPQKILSRLPLHVVEESVLLSPAWMRIVLYTQWSHKRSKIITLEICTGLYQAVYRWSRKCYNLRKLNVNLMNIWI